MPGTPTERAALGYLQANCAHCHNQARPERTGSRCYAPYVPLDFWLTVGHLDSPSSTPTYRSAIGNVILPGEPDRSRLLELVSRRGKGRQMPPLATEEVDERAVTMLREWIAGMRR